jgi:hypothetical protein
MFAETLLKMLACLKLIGKIWFAAMIHFTGTYSGIHIQT